MTSRERILAAIDHREPDRIPIDLGATPSSGISAIAYGRLNRHLGFGQSKTRIYDLVQQLAQPEEAILERFNIDAVDLGRTFNTRAGLSPSRWPPAVGGPWSRMAPSLPSNSRT